MSTDIPSLLMADILEPRTSFSLMDSSSIWVVRSGVLRVFAVRGVNGPEGGALHPLFEVGAGQAAVGLLGMNAGDIGLVARRSDGSEIVKCPRAGVRQFAAASGRPEDGFALLIDWISALSLTAATDPMPQAADALHHGTRVAADDQPRILSPTDPLVWIGAVSGRCLFLGRSDAELSAGTRAYPLSRHAWLELHSNSALSTAGECSTLTDDEVWAGVAAFHTHALTCIARNLDHADQRDRQRFRARDEADARAVSVALQDLASPLARTRAYPSADPAQALDTPLMRACRMIGRHLGVTMTPHRDMVRGRPVTNPVAAVAQSSGVRHRRVALKGAWLRRSTEPLLVFRDADEKPAALLPRAARGYSIYDPESNTIAPLDAKTAATLNPFAVMFYRPFPQKALSVWDLLAFGFTGSSRDLLMIAAVSIATGVLALLTPVVTGVVFDSVVPNAERSELVMVAALLVVTALVTSLFNLARGFALLRLQGRLSLSLQCALWDRLLSLPLPFFREYATGDLAQRSLAFAQIRDVLSGTVLSALLSGIFSVSSFALLFYYSGRLAVVATILALLALALTLVAGTLQVKLQRRISDSMGRISGLVVEFISGIAKFRIAGAERRAFVLWVTEFAAQRRRDFQARRITTWVAVFNSVYVVACTGVLFYMNSGVEGSRDSALSTGAFLAFTVAFGQFMAAALAMGGAFIGVANIVPLYERASPILRTLPEVLSTQTAPGELKGEVEAHHLVFRYHADGPEVMRDVSFRVQPGEYVAFVGPSGSGKSTLFRLLLGFDTPLGGAIHFDGMDLARLDLGAVRRQIGVVLQSGTLLAGSIWENICGATVHRMEDVWEAARMAGVDEDIRRMPMGMHTIVQAGGGGLSGGQRQRILIARALVGKPRLLLFDEATSALDNRTQAIVSESLKTLHATRIVIAHRLSTILGADRIFVLDQGRIVQSGTYGELMREPGLFRALAERQLT
jgi:NHLM bacteriocin system ABC transporter ATP-binding protein